MQLSRLSAFMQNILREPCGPLQYLMLRLLDKSSNENIILFRFKLRRERHTTANGRCGANRVIYLFEYCVIMEINFSANAR